MSNPTIIGLYGVPGSGKSTLLNFLRLEFGEESFEYVEGSEMIASLLPDGLLGFDKLSENEKSSYRQRAVEKIKHVSQTHNKPAIVTGHFMFWREGEAGRRVFTRSDGETYSHIIYLDTPVEEIAIRRYRDVGRDRPSETVRHIGKWQMAEKNELRKVCRENGTLFLPLNPGRGLNRRIVALIHDIKVHSEAYNRQQAEQALQTVLKSNRLQTVLMIDGDGTLTNEDTGKMFWEKFSRSIFLETEEWPLKVLFKSSLGYSYTAFRQATLLSEEWTNDSEYDTICQEVASEVTIHPEWVSLLQSIAAQEHVQAVVVTSGSRCIWTKILEISGLSRTVEVIGGGRIADGYVVTPQVKANLVERLHFPHKIYVWGFGDSVVDLDMLNAADQAIVVVGPEKDRSQSMELALSRAIDNGLVARQMLLPRGVKPRLNKDRLPLVGSDESEFRSSILTNHRQDFGFRVCHATDKPAAKVLMAAMRDATVAGPALREAHRRVGWYLAVEYLTNELGVEEYNIPHVLGHTVKAHRVLYERQLSIVALMRGGEPMAFGINDAFPSASFIHASQPEDIRADQLEGQRTVVLVDSVINTGATIVRFARYVHERHSQARILVVAGVVQAGFIGETHLAQTLRPLNASLIALRISDNKFTGSGGSDTGNRLFNTTNLA